MFSIRTRGLVVKAARPKSEMRMLKWSVGSVVERRMFCSVVVV